jgi:DNA mismatch repair ATPase MutS
VPNSKKFQNPHHYPIQETPYKNETTNPPNPKREITGIYSPGTSIDNLEKEKTSQTIVSIILEEGKDNGKKVPLIGLSGIDITSGKILFQEIHSPNDDIYYALDQLKNYLIMLNEVIHLHLY